jgi:hypothetical protein
MIENSIELAKTQRVHKLLAVATGLEGFPSPTITQRFGIMEDWATASAGQIKVALVVQAWLINPQRFGVLVARNRGLNIAVFTSEQDASAWLLGSQ